MNPTLILTFVIIALTLLTSFRGLKNQSVAERYQFETGRVISYREYYRLLSFGFLHLSWLQLGINMLALYVFAAFLTGLSWAHVLLIYLLSMIISSLLALFFHRHQPAYRFAGASGGVYGLGFAAMALFPAARLMLFALIPLPAWFFVVLFAALSLYAVRFKDGQPGHEAQLGGGLAGLIAAVLLNQELFDGNYAIVLLIVAPVIVGIFLLLTRPDLLRIAGTRQGALPVYLDIDDKYNAARADRQRELDRLLDKISQSGVESLSKAERERLEELSR